MSKYRLNGLFFLTQKAPVDHGMLLKRQEGDTGQFNC